MFVINLPFVVVLDVLVDDVVVVDVLVDDVVVVEDMLVDDVVEEDVVEKDVLTIDVVVDELLVDEVIEENVLVDDVVEDVNVNENDAVVLIVDVLAVVFVIAEESDNSESRRKKIVSTCGCRICAMRNKYRH